MIELRPGTAILQVKGKGARALFEAEAGIHRWQGVSKNKVHSSTLTVAVLDEERAATISLQTSDLDITTTRGSGKGGQHRNVTDSCVVIVHKPSQIRVRIDSERSQLANKVTALEILKARLLEREATVLSGSRADKRREQIMGAARSDKRRTVQEQNGQVTDHVTGKRCDLDAYLKGHIDKLR